MSSETGDETGDGGDSTALDRVRRAVLSPSVVTTLLAVLVALVLSGVLVALADDETRGSLSYFFARPNDTLAAGWSAVSNSYAALFQGSFGSFRAVGETLKAATPLTLAGLAVAVPFRAGLFNIGGEGQLIVGGAVAGLAGFTLDGLPLLVHLPLALLVGVLAGGAMGALPGLLKARTGAHEVITTIMLNNIAAPMLLAVLATSLFQRVGRSDPISKPILDSARLPSPSGTRVDAGLVVAVLATAVIWYLLDRSTLGFQIKAVGANPVAAETAGMSAAGITATTFAIAGALAGLAGAAIVLSGGNAAVTTGFAAGRGFDGITVALLGRGRAWGTLAAGIAFGALEAGGLRMQADTGTPVDLISVVQALVILFIAAPLLIQAIFRIRTGDSSVGASVAKGWGA